MKKKKDKATPLREKYVVSPAITRFPSPLAPPKKQLSDEEKIDIIADRFRDILEVLGLDTKDDSIAKTPYRVAKMYVQEVFSGLKPETFPPVSFFEGEFNRDYNSNMVLVKVGFTSFCEHHFVPMNGTAYIAYLPNKYLIGLSKIPRIVRYFSRRPQLQERLTAQIADSLSILLGHEDVAVSVAAYHYCVMARGIEDENGHTISNVLRGRFNDSDTLRREFFEGINRTAP